MPCNQVIPGSRMSTVITQALMCPLLLTWLSLTNTVFFLNCFIQQKASVWSVIKTDFLILFISRKHLCCPTIMHELTFFMRKLPWKQWCQTHFWPHHNSSLVGGPLWLWHWINVGWSDITNTYMVQQIDDDFWNQRPVENVCQNIQFIFKGDW